MRALKAVPLLLALCACASVKIDTIQVGPWFAARDWREVEVFASREETRRPWGGIGVIHGPLMSARTPEDSLKRIELAARKSAAAMGADGVIVTINSAQASPQIGEFQEPEIYLSALAIKYVTTVSTPVAK
jgi:hypothetical protein